MSYLYLLHKEVTEYIIEVLTKMGSCGTTKGRYLIYRGVSKCNENFLLKLQAY